jgi:sugar phosphate isomerase/epimerase
MTPATCGLIGLLREEYQRDLWGSLERLAQIGYGGLEGGEMLLAGDVAANRRRLADLGLAVWTVSASRESLRDDLDGVLAKAEALGSRRVSVWWGPAEAREQLARDAELYNAAGARLAAAGVRLCYHNHDHEFRASFDGLYALDWLVAATDPAAVWFEIDVAWVTFGGEDPSRVLRRLAGRVPAIHVKDLWDLSERGRFTAVGTGVVDVAGAVGTALDLGIEQVVVEQDTLRDLSAWETVAVSYLNLKERGLVR